MQENIVFLYGEEETAYKLCAKHVRKAYPYALFKTESGQGHLTYVSRQTEAYIQFIKELCL